jgi:UTP--glucose-1-phosphate uridylyltransferase
MGFNSEELIRTKMRARGIDEAVIDDFVRKARRAASQSAYVPLSDAHTPGPDLLFSLSPVSERLSSLHRKGLELLDNTLVIKLNGGLGTTMGGRVPKGILEAKDGLSYLDIVVRQIKALHKEYGVRTPLMLMNSFFTHAPTMEIIERLDLPILTLIQSRVPRLLADSFAPLEAGDDQDWAPSGHGDVYDCLRRSTWLERLIGDGYRWAFISNLDNLAACLDPWILGLMAEDDVDFLMEVTDRTNADRKGGTPVFSAGRLQLLEIAQVDPDERSAFQDIHRFPFFNTNNIWVNLHALSSILDQRALELPLIQNRKTVAGREIIQIETAMGAALGRFPRAGALRVGRERFFPTKKVSDLFVLRTDACVLDGMARLRRNPMRPDNLSFMPRVFFSDDFLDSPLKIGQRFEDPASVSVLRADILDVYGSVFFESNVTLEGRVEIRGGSGDPYRICSGAILCEGRFPPFSAREAGSLGTSEHDLYPFELSRMAVEKVWGSSSIGWGVPREMANLPSIGELWETYDGREEASVILNGPHRLTPLRELTAALGPSLLGTKLTQLIGRPFPILIKYLFPSQTLSVQVHPSDEYAVTHGKAKGKQEMWLVLSAAPDSFTILGWRPGLDEDAIRSAIAAGDFESILNVVRPKAGDVYFIPPGTVHALGPGVAALEIQENSDVTYRLHDWDRMKSDGTKRRLHIDDALGALSYEYELEYAVRPLVVKEDFRECSYLCACSRFAVCKWVCNGKRSLASDPTRFWVMNVILGQGRLSWPGGDPLWVEQGSTVLIPAGLGEFDIDPVGSITLVKSWVPDLIHDVIEPLKAAGFNDAEVAALGGAGPRNQVRPLL